MIEKVTSYARVSNYRSRFGCTVFNWFHIEQFCKFSISVSQEGKLNDVRVVKLLSSGKVDNPTSKCVPI